MSKKLTDNQIAQLYLDLKQQYLACQNQGKSPFETYNQLYSNVCYSLYDSRAKSALYHINNEEKLKAFTVLNTFFYACPSYKKLEESQRAILFNYQNSREEIQAPLGHCTFCHHHGFNWLLLSSLDAASMCFPGSSNYSSNTKSEDEQKAMLFLLFIIMVLSAAILTFVSLYYMFSQALNSAERFIYNEGWLDASITLSSMVASGLLSGFLAVEFIAAPLAAFAIAVGVSNPVGIVIAGIIALSLMGAALGCFVTNKVKSHVIKENNPDALDPYEPSRFRLTKHEEDNLIKHNIDPVKVKCAMAAIREEMGDKKIPSLLNRLFTSKGEKIQGQLDVIRKLRQGKLSMVSVGDLQFELWHAYPPTPITNPLPSAPPLEMAQPPELPEASAPSAPPSDEDVYSNDYSAPYSLYSYMY